MSGLCKNCMFKGDVEKCAIAVCGQHESWYGVTQRATNKAQAAEIAELKALLWIHTGNKKFKLDQQAKEVE